MEWQVADPPLGLEEAHRTLLTPPALSFIAQISMKFKQRVAQMLNDRHLKKAHLEKTGGLPDFLPETKDIREAEWKVEPVPRRLINRQVDLGDVSPASTEHFVAALQSNAQGIQTDFDDGHCPTWSAQLKGMYNVYQAVRGSLYQGINPIGDLPVLMLRPRAWNMMEHNMLVKGQQVPGPIFDFGLLMFHNAKILYEAESGPYFYLSKLEGHKEARLWRDIFIFTEEKLGMKVGSIKATVLIENILAAFEMQEILYELRWHSAGLNCGIWDYCASIISKLGKRSEYVLPDRSKYVNMQQHFLKSYLALTIQTCHRRGCHATGGMNAVVLPDQQGPDYRRALEAACRAKLSEIMAGVDGFMVYDIRLVKPMQELFNMYVPSANQLRVLRADVNITKQDLLTMPSGGVTLAGLQHNIAVAVLFIESWLKGKGHFYYKGAVEDSATAEISRSQVWQWICHNVPIEGSKQLIASTLWQLIRHSLPIGGGKLLITSTLVRTLSQQFLDQYLQENPDLTMEDRKRLQTAVDIFLGLVTRKKFKKFITTYLMSKANSLLKSKL